MPWKRPSTSYDTVPGQKKFGVNPQAFCPCPSFKCHYKTGSNAMPQKPATVRPQQIPWQVYLTFTCWNIWLASNEWIFRDQSRSQHSIIYSSVQAATEFYYLAGTTKRTLVLLPWNIQWHVSSYPFITHNTDGSALGNLGIAGATGILRNQLGQWISAFSLHLGLVTNNIAELTAVREGLAMAWTMG